MIFRIQDNRLYRIVLDGNKITEDGFLKLQSKGKIKFIKVERSELPKPIFDAPQTQYKLDKDGKTIIVDRERTISDWVELKHKALQELIMDKYPQVKQGSDLADKLYYETELKVNGVKDLEKVVYDTIVAIKTGSTMDKALKNTKKANRAGIEQLVKTGIRVKWVIDCKRALKEAIENTTEPVYPDFPEV